jgi:hypothetical protein
MRGLDPRIHALLAPPKTWMLGTRPGMTNEGLPLQPTPDPLHRLMHLGG